MMCFIVKQNARHFTAELRSHLTQGVVVKMLKWTQKNPTKPTQKPLWLFIKKKKKCKEENVC